MDLAVTGSTFSVDAPSRIQLAASSNTASQCVSLLPRIAHSQKTSTRQLASMSARSTFRSLLRFPRILAFQKVRLLFGHLKFSQSCPCQKHPCTNTTVLCRESTRSGVPGSAPTCTRNRSPLRWSPCRIDSSGFVSFARIRDISRLRAGLMWMLGVTVPIVRLESAALEDSLQWRWRFAVASRRPRVGT